MGWWSKTIMGGDTPLDFKSEFFDLAGVDQFNDKGPKVKKAFDESQDKFIKGIDKVLKRWGCGKTGSDYYNDKKSIAFQVLAVQMMETGCIIKEDIRSLMLEWIPKDGWAAEDDERKEKIDKLLESLNGYTGKPTGTEYEGLLDKIYEKMAGK
jgi:hypothetical protein